MKNMTKITLLATAGVLLMQLPSHLEAQKTAKFATQKQSPSTMTLPKKLYLSWSQAVDDYTIGVKVTTYNYTKSIPGLKSAEQANLATKKDGFVIYIFDGSSEIARYHIAGSLLKRNQPTFIMFMPRTRTANGTASWTREFLTLENGKICIYRIWVEKDPSIGLSKSVDFGKRVVITAPSGKAVDAATVCADNKENISFQDIDGAAYMWDSTKETVVALPSTFKKIADKTWAKINTFAQTDTGFSFTAPSGKDLFVLSSNKTKKIDPLKVNLDGLKKGFGKVGTSTQPLKINIDEDTNAPVSSTTFQPGQALALLDLLCGDNKALKEPIQKGAKALAMWVNQVAWNKLVTQPDLSEENKKMVAGWIKQVADTVINQSKLTAEIKFRAREEGGITSILKKAEPKAEEVVAAQNEDLIKSKLLGSDTEIKRVLAKFAQVPPQKSWVQWFDEINQDVELKVLITYLATAPEEEKQAKLKLFFNPGPKLIQKSLTIADLGNNSNIIRRAKSAAAKTTTTAPTTIPVKAAAPVSAPAKPVPSRVRKPAWIK